MDEVLAKSWGCHCLAFDVTEDMMKISMFKSMLYNMASDLLNQNMIAVDDVARGVASSSSAMTLTMKDEVVFVFDHKVPVVRSLYVFIVVRLNMLKKLSSRDTLLLIWRRLTHLALDKMAAISQTTFSDAFSWKKILYFDPNFTKVCS